MRKFHACLIAGVVALSATSAFAASDHAGHSAVKAEDKANAQVIKKDTSKKEKAAAGKNSAKQGKDAGSSGSSDAGGRAATGSAAGVTGGPAATGGHTGSTTNDSNSPKPGK
jgi:hypothetical protein